MILVSINDENRARLELLMDEVFPQTPGERSFGELAELGGPTNLFSDNHEHVLVYGNSGFVLG